MVKKLTRWTKFASAFAGLSKRVDWLFIAEWFGASLIITGTQRIYSPAALILAGAMVLYAVERKPDSKKDKRVG